MSEPNTPAPDAQPEAPAVDDAQPDELTPDALRKQLEKARREAANYRTKVRDLEPLAKKAQELEDKDKTEVERLTARAEQAERERGELTARAMRLEVAFEKGLTPAQAKRLVGATREELEADADEILRDFPAIKPDGRPRGDAGLGPRTPPPPVTDGTPRSLIAAGLASSDAAKRK